MTEIIIDKDRLWIDKLPESCPFCHKLIKPQVNGRNFNLSLTDTHNRLVLLDLFLSCSNDLCQSSFIGYYNQIGPNEYSFIKTSFGRNQINVFSNTIYTLSPRFCEIYNQALAAEKHELLEICGIGYRKAFEFLIKDYCINLNMAFKSTIERQRLSKTIKSFIHDEKFKQIVLRSAWLGNDETHYKRIHVNFDINDFKKLIGTILNMIDTDKLIDELIIKMPSADM